MSATYTLQGDWILRDGEKVLLVDDKTLVEKDAILKDLQNEATNASAQPPNIHHKVLSEPTLEERISALEMITQLQMEEF